MSQRCEYGFPFNGYSYRTQRNHIFMYDPTKSGGVYQDYVIDAPCDYNCADTIFEIADAELSSDKEVYQVFCTARGHRSFARFLVPYIRKIGKRLAESEGDFEYTKASHGKAGLYIARAIAVQWWNLKHGTEKLP